MKIKMDLFEENAGNIKTSYGNFSEVCNLYKSSIIYKNKNVNSSSKIYLENFNRFIMHLLPNWPTHVFINLDDDENYAHVSESCPSLKMPPEGFRIFSVYQSLILYSQPIQCYPSCIQLHFSPNEDVWLYNFKI